MKSYSQNLEKHQWKERVLLIVADNAENINLAKQLEELRSDIEGLNERKLVVYQFFKDYYKYGLVNEIKGEREPNNKKYHNSSKSFEIVLIGLDGGVKYKTTEFLDNSSLFAIIDGMPMRRTELNKNE